MAEQATHGPDLEWLRTALDRLPPLERLALDLRHGLTSGKAAKVEEVARRLKVPARTAEYLLAAGAAKIRVADPEPN